MQSYLRWWHTTQLPASQVLQPCANNDSQHSHYTVSLIYVFSPSGPGCQKQEREGKEKVRGRRQRKRKRRRRRVLVWSCPQHKAHLQSPVSACAPAGRGRDMAPEGTSSHGLSGKHITAHQRKATLISTSVSLFSNISLHQPAHRVKD